jgi:hypothetical protein
MSAPVMPMNYTMNRSIKNITNSSGSTMFMPFSSINGKTKTILGLEIKPSKAYRGCGSCGSG